MKRPDRRLSPSNRTADITGDIVLDWVDLQADAHQGLQVGVGLQVLGVEQVESLPGAEQGGAGEKEILKCFPMGVLCAPTQRQSTQAFPVPWNLEQVKASSLDRPDKSLT